jgi:hypothetical protein
MTFFAETRSHRLTGPGDPVTRCPGDTPGLPFHLDGANHHMLPAAHRPAVAERLKPHRKRRKRQTAAAATATALFSYSYPPGGV